MHAHDDGTSSTWKKNSKHFPTLRSYFQVPKPKKKPGQEQLFEKETSEAAAVAVLSRGEVEEGSSYDEEE